MVTWNFPATIAAGDCPVIYVEFAEPGIEGFGNIYMSADAAIATYVVQDGVGDFFQVQALSHSDTSPEFNLQVRCPVIPQCLRGAEGYAVKQIKYSANLVKGKPAGTIDSLGFVLGGTVFWGLE